MEINLTVDALDDLSYWKSVKNDKVLKRIKILLQNIQRSIQRYWQARATKA